MSEKKKKQPEQPSPEPRQAGAAPGADEAEWNESAARQDAEEQALPAADPEKEALQAEADKWKDQYLRLAAEYENYRKRTDKEKESRYADGMLSAVSSFLPVYDNLERAAAQPSTDDNFKKGVELILKQYRDLFEKFSITETPGVGEPFNPEYHNAVMHVEDEALPENSVAEVFQKGFLMKDRVVRCAMVKAAN